VAGYPVGTGYNRVSDTSLDDDDDDNVRFNELMTEERLLSQEVEALDRRFDSWSLTAAAADAVNPTLDGAKKIHQKSAALPSSRDVIIDLPPDVAAFEVTVACHMIRVHAKQSRVLKQCQIIILNH